MAKQRNSSIKRKVKIPNEQAKQVESVPKVNGIKTFLMDMSSYEKLEAEPRGTMLVLKDNTNELGINVRDEDDSVGFSHYKDGKFAGALHMNMDAIITMIHKM